MLSLPITQFFLKMPRICNKSSKTCHSWSSGHPECQRWNCHKVHRCVLQTQDSSWCTRSQWAPARPAWNPVAVRLQCSQRCAPAQHRGCDGAAAHYRERMFSQNYTQTHKSLNRFFKRITEIAQARLRLSDKGCGWMWMSITFDPWK